VGKATFAGLAVAAVTLAGAASATPSGQLTATCAHAGVQAVINHLSVCLTSGARCKSSFQRQYERYSFYCFSGVLARQRRTPPPPAPVTVTTTPELPPPWTVDFTVKTAGDPSSIVAAPYPIPGCASATVTDVSNSKNLGPGTRAEFSGVKELTCPDGGTIDIQYDVVWTICASANQGTWQIVGGTGNYSALSGKGQLVGTYFPGGCPDSSVSGWIYDRYTGTVSSG
jgi:hypothetical protein